jgi:hypothetical protein
MAPWVGPSYNIQPFGGVRLMVLGESEYEWEPGCLTPDIASKLISQIANGEWTHKFYSNIFRVLTGISRRDAGPSAYKDFWYSISFYNFVQDSVGTRPRCRPTGKMWNNGLKYLEPVLLDLSPRGILVLGKELWEYLGSFGVANASLDGNWTMSTAGVGPIPVTHIFHPSSSRYKYSVWRPGVENWLSFLKRNGV